MDESATQHAEKVVNKNEDIEYEINDKPPLRIAIPLAIQHLVAAFSGIVAVALVVGGVLGFGVEKMTFLVNATLFMAGIATVIQSYGFGPVGAI